jgi:hypothetical protein
MFTIPRIPAQALSKPIAGAISADDLCARFGWPNVSAPCAIGLDVACLRGTRGVHVDEERLGEWLTAARTVATPALLIGVAIAPTSSFFPTSELLELFGWGGEELETAVRRLAFPRTTPRGPFRHAVASWVRLFHAAFSSARAREAAGIAVIARA